MSDKGKEPQNKRPSNTVDKLKSSRAERLAQEALIIENIEQFQRALNDMGQSPSGNLVLKTLIRACGVFNVKNGVDGVALIENNAKRNLYLEFIRPHLEPAIRQELES